MLFDPSNPNSMSSIYRELSYGTLEVTGEVIPYVRAPQPYKFYTAGKSGTGTKYPHNTPGLLFDALTEYCKTDNLKRFDTDGDGFVDGIFLIHAGGGAEAESNPAKRTEMIWSHKWVLPTEFVNQGVKVYAYSTEPEDGRVGVFSHEFGHVLGLPDLYDTSYRSEGVGNWCLMGGGSWGGSGNKPTRMSCWCLSKLGWVKPVNAKSEAYTLDTLENNAKDCLRVWTDGKSGPEYFMIENRQTKGRDTALPGSGLAVWHIDESRSDNTNPLAYKVGLMQADGKRDLELAKNNGDDGDLFPGSSKKTGISAIFARTAASSAAAFSCVWCGRLSALSSAARSFIVARSSAENRPLDSSWSFCLPPRSVRHSSAGVPSWIVVSCDHLTLLQVVQYRWAPSRRRSLVKPLDECGADLELSKQKGAAVEPLPTQPSGDLVIAFARVARTAHGDDVGQRVPPAA